MKVRINFYVIGLVLLTMLAACSKQAANIPINEEIDLDKKAKVPVQAEKPIVEESVVTQLPANLEKKAYDFVNIHFDFDKYEMRSGDREILAKHARYLNENKEIKVAIEGHCDERGTIEYNLALGEKRAQTVKDYLVNAGIKTERLRTISYGKERPADSRSSEEAWAKNRRASFVVNN